MTSDRGDPRPGRPAAPAVEPAAGAPHPTPHEVHAHIVARNPVYQGLGVEIVDIAPGRATFAMAVRPDMANVHGTCHGGLIFTLADIAFGFAAQASNERAMSTSAEVQFLAPAMVGTRLVARAVELWREDRNAVYDVRIEGEGGRVVALLRGRMRYLGGPHIEADREVE